MRLKFSKGFLFSIALLTAAAVGLALACSSEPSPAVQPAPPAATQTAPAQTPIQAAETPTATPDVPTPTATAATLPSTPTPSPEPVEVSLAPVINLADVQAKLTSNRQKWESMSIEDYRFKYRNICFCPPMITNPVTLTVRKGAIESAILVDTGKTIEEAEFRRYMTIDALFDLIQDAIDRKARQIQVSYDPVLGYPMWGSIDYDLRVADEERSFSAENLVELTEQAFIEGRWEGVIDLGAETQLGIEVDFRTQADGSLTATIDIPVQGVDDLVLSNISLEGPQIHLEMAQAGGVFNGEIAGDTISGDFSQGGVTFPFELTRVEVKAQEPVLYREEEVTFQNDNFTLAGTLSLPPGDGPHPAVVLITGSGAQTRNENIFGFKVFAALADHLTRQGIAVLRYDDRGVGGSTGNLNNATLIDLAGDALAAVEMLMERPEVNSEQIGLLGHSEGGLVAPIAALSAEGGLTPPSAASPNIAFMVLMAAPAATMEDILTTQSRLIMAANGGTEEQIQEQNQLQMLIFRAVRTGEGWADVEAGIRKQARQSVDALPESQRNAIPNVDELIEMSVRQQIQGLQIPAFRFLLDYDPAPVLEATAIPVLALFGELDLQVPPDLNIPIMEQALESGDNPDFAIETTPHANHLFQKAQTGSPVEYATLKREFAPGFLDTITDWLLQRVDVASAS
jgi:pimeloyl-ACP methyl ester carboxylesterase